MLIFWVPDVIDFNSSNVQPIWHYKHKSTVYSRPLIHVLSSRLNTNERQIYYYLMYKKYSTFIPFPDMGNGPNSE